MPATPPEHTRSTACRCRAACLLLAVGYMPSCSGTDKPGSTGILDTQSTLDSESITDTSSPTETADTASGEEHSACPQTEGFQNFVTREGDDLMDGDNELRFISFNVPNLHMLEDPDWHIPQAWEQEDAICSIAQMGGGVLRIYTLSVGETYNDVPRHVPGPGVFSEDLFVALDKALELADKLGVRVIIPLVDQWSWWGGIAEYAAFRGLEQDDFWTDPDIMSDFKETITYLLTRTNTYTGRQYLEDPAILAWETGNELDAPTAWTAEIAAFIKGLDPNHLVLDGHYGIDEASLDNPDVDIVTNHYYWPWPYADDYAAASSADRAIARGRRPFVVGEFGFVGTEQVEAMLEQVISDGTSGALIWSLRYHDSGGGFYWHTEQEISGVLYRSYHWPGFASGEPYEETALLSAMREHAYAIAGLESPPVPVPDPPEILSAESSQFISWRGSTGASSYELQRADAENGTWTVVATGFDDAEEPDTAMVSDPSATVGDSYYYRMLAVNSSGSSQPSDPVGPVPASTTALLEDELDDMSLMGSHSKNLTIDTSNSGYFDGDSSRICRSAPSTESFTYQVDGAIDRAEITVYFWPWEDRPQVLLQVSSDGSHFSDLSPEMIDQGGDWQKIIYRSADLPADSDWFRVVLEDHDGEAWNPQVGRVELEFSL